MRIENILEKCIAAGCTDAEGTTAAARKPVIAVPMANNEEVIRCIGKVIENGLADFLLIGREQDIVRTAEEASVRLGESTFVDADGPAEACALAAGFASAGRADILMKGLVQTAEFTRSVLKKEYHLLEEGALISHVGVFDIPSYHKLLIVTDAALNVAPTVEQKIIIARNAVTVARSIGVTMPRIACVAPVEVVSDKVPSTVEAQAIVNAVESGTARGVLGDVEIAGPLGLDAAISAEAAHIKKITGPVPGDADILLLPNLEAGNVLYKSLTYFSQARVAGIVSGARVPIVLTSRADSEESKYLSVLLALAGAGVSTEPARR